MEKTEIVRFYVDVASFDFEYFETLLGDLDSVVTFGTVKDEEIY